jgi:hypothetical protein
MRPSRRTWVLGVLFLGGVLAAWGGGAWAAGAGSERLAVAIGGSGELVVIGAAAIVVFLAVARWKPSDAVRLPWVMLGGGIVLFFAGNLAYTVYSVSRGVPPGYPGLPDVFFVGMYGLLGAGALAAGASYRRVVGVREPAFAAAAVTAVALIAIVWGLVIPWLQRPDLDAGQTLVSLFYPFADVLLLLGPAVFVVFVVRQLGEGALAWPWAFVAFGAAVLAGTDAGYAWLRAVGAYRPGSVIDMGWMIAFAAIAVGAALARDAYDSRSARSGPSEDGDAVRAGYL